VIQQKPENSGHFAALMPLIGICSHLTLKKNVANVACFEQNYAL